MSSSISLLVMAKKGQLVKALKNRDECSLRRLLEDVDPCEEVFTWPLLLHAIRENNPRFVRILLEAGANVESKDGYDRNAIEIACLKLCSIETVHLLMEFGAKFVHDAFRAAAEGDVNYLEKMRAEEIKELLSLRDNSGYSIVHYAAVQNHKDFLDKLNLTPEEMKMESDNELHENPLLLVAYAGTTDMIDYMVETYNVDPNSAGGCKDGTTPLLYAAYSGSIEMVEHLVNKYGAVLRDNVDSYGQTPLLNAAYTGRQELFDHIVQKYYPNGGYREEKNKGGKSALLLTVLDNNLSMFSYLVSKYGFDPVTDRDKNQYSSLLLAAWYGHIEILDYIVDNFDCDLIRDKDVGGRTCTINSIRNNKLHMLKHLLEVRNVDVFSVLDAEGANALINSCRGGCIEIFEYLLDISGNKDELRRRKGEHSSGSNSVCIETDAVDTVSNYGENDPSSCSEVDNSNSDCSKSAGIGSIPGSTGKKRQFDVHLDRDNDMYSCLSTAIWYGQLGMIDHLVSTYRVELRDSMDKNGHGPLILAVLGGKLKVMDHLIEKYKLDIHDERDKSGNTPLMIAAARGNKPMVTRMVETYKCDPANEKNPHGLSSLLYAVMFKHKEMIDFLIDTYHCDVHQCTVDAEYALHFACDDGHMEIFTHLVDNHDCKYQLLLRTEKDGETPFLRAVRCGKIAMVDYLIEKYNVDLLREKDSNGNCPLLVACRYGQKELIDHFILKYKYPIRNAVNHKGENASEVARSRELFATERYILSYYGYLMHGYQAVSHKNIELWSDLAMEFAGDTEACLARVTSLGIEPCIICYDVFDPSNNMRHLPTIQCATCNVCVHSHCYFTWTKKARRADEVCVMCQQPIK